MIRNTALHRLPSLTISCPGGTARLTAFKSSSRAASCATRGRDGGNLWLRSIFDCGDAAADLVATCPLTCSSTSCVPTTVSLLRQPLWLFYHAAADTQKPQRMAAY